MAELVLLPDERGERGRHGGGGVERVGGLQRQPRLVQGGAQDGQATGWSKLLLPLKVSINHYLSDACFMLANSTQELTVALLAGGRGETDAETGLQEAGEGERNEQREG